MRIGINPEKENKVLTGDAYHRVIVPVYIPNLEEEYFKDGLKILKLCIESLLHTIHSKTRVSIINNGCCIEVLEYLNKVYESNNQVDQLLDSKINLGKVNAINAIVKGNIEEFITITDADVLFKHGWQVETEKIFSEFPYAGMVSPVPSSVGYKSKFLNSTYYYGVFKGKLRFSNVQSPEGMQKFEQSIGRKMYNDDHLDKYLTIVNKNGKKAVVGCGHFVATLKADVFSKAPNFPSNFKIVGGSENTYIDIPNDKSGYLRLATMENLAFHLGNKVEDWMYTYFEDIMSTNNNAVVSDFSINDSKRVSVIGQFVGKIFYNCIIKIKKVKRLYFSFLGFKTESY